MQFLVLAGNRFWFYILLLMYLGYHIIQLWCCVSFFGIFLLWRESGSGEKLAVFLLWRESFVMSGKKNIKSSVWRVHDHYYDRKKNSLRPEKKSSSRLSGGCVSFWFWREIGSFFVVAGKFYYYRKKKIQSSVWRVRDHYYDRKKKIQSSVWWVVLLYQFLVLAGNMRSNTF